MSDFEHIWGTIQSTLLHPFENNLYHYIPILGAFTWGHTPIVRADYGQGSMIPKDPAQKIFDEVETLRKCAGLSKTIDLYTSLIFHFTSFGGKLSCTNPIIVIPYHRLFRPDGSAFCNNGNQAALAKDIHALTDDETKFYIAREISHIQFGDVILKTAARAAFIAALCFLYAASLSWAGMIGIAAGAIGMVLLVERVHEYAIDLFAIKTLEKAFADPKRSLDAALSSLEKEREKNMERRRENRFCQFYLTPSGDNLLDIRHPLLSSRINALLEKIPQPRFQKQDCLAP